jgi:hypothetical protein
VLNRARFQNVTGRDPGLASDSNIADEQSKTRSRLNAFSERTGTVEKRIIVIFH